MRATTLATLTQAKMKRVSLTCFSISSFNLYVFFLYLFSLCILSDPHWRLLFSWICFSSFLGFWLLLPRINGFTLCGLFYFLSVSVCIWVWPCVCVYFANVCCSISFKYRAPHHRHQYTTHIVLVFLPKKRILWPNDLLLSCLFACFNVPVLLYALLFN